MRSAPRFFDWIGGAALVLALLLASPGVRVVHADVADAEVDFSWDPALEPDAAAVPSAAPKAGAACAAETAPPVIPSVRQIRGLQGMALPVADGEEELNSLNNRGYNIGSPDPALDLQELLAEVRRKER
jgi:hypothetical protein